MQSTMDTLGTIQSAIEMMEDYILDASDQTKQRIVYAKNMLHYALDTLKSQQQQEKPMQIQWISVEEALPDEGRKVYIQGKNFVCQAYYHAGMYWQDANNGTQRHALGAVTQWAEVDHVQEVVDHVADKAMEHERHGLAYIPTEALEQMAEDYSKGRWATEWEIEAAYRGYLAGYCQALELNSPKKLDSWISVKERLPEIGAPCLVTCHEERYAIAEYDGIKWTTLNSIAYYHPIVTHWQELPEVPKEEK